MAGVVVPVHVGDLQFAFVDGSVGGGHNFQSCPEFKTLEKKSLAR
jgi:hypothetical protein